MHVQSDANGLPLLVGLSAANVHDSLALKPMITGHQTRHGPHRGRHSQPQRLRADKAYDVPHLRKWLWGRHIGVRIARKGNESSERLGRRRWVVERTMSWLSGYRRPSPRYERQPSSYLAFLGLAATLCCPSSRPALAADGAVLDFSMDNRVRRSVPAHPNRVSHATSRTRPVATMTARGASA